MRENGSTFSFGFLATMLACAAAFLGIGAPAASAAPEAQPGYAYLTSFGSDQIGPPFTGIRNGIGVDSNGNIFAVNQNQGPVPVFAPDAEAGGKYLTTITELGAIYPMDVAVDPITDDVYGNDRALNGQIRRYVSDGQPVPTYSVAPGFEPVAGENIAVDPTTHDLLVADGGAESIRRYDTTGALVETIATPSVAPQRLAVAADGTIYTSSTSDNDITHFGPTGTVLGKIEGVGPGTALAVDPAGRLLAVVGEKLKLYSPSGVLLSESPAAPGDSGVAFDPNGSRLYGLSAVVAHAYVLGTVPGVEAPDVSAVEPHSAHIEAEVDPGAGPPAGSIARFEYSEDGGKTWQSTADQTPAGATTIEADLANLKPNLEYQVRIFAKNNLLSKTSGTVAFSTPEIAPEVETGNATDVTETSAVLNGTINPAGKQTTYYFEYGLTSAYGSRVPVSIDAVAGSGRVNRLFGRTIFGLQPGTTYHFRLVAENALGVTEGAGRTFTTVATGEIPQRSYEQVTPVDKKGNPLDVFQGFYAKADGSAFAYASRGGDNGSPFLSFAISRRGGSDWESPIDLSIPVNGYSGSTTTTTTLAISPDFTHAFVASNLALAPGATDGGVNLYVLDVATREFTLAASFPFGGDGFPFGTFTALQTADKFQASAPDMSWVVFRSPIPFLPEAPSEALYRWSEEDGLEIASVLPNGEPTSISDSTVSQPPIRKVSADGKRIYFESGINFSGGPIYVRENGETTKAISVSHIPGDPDTPRAARLKGISADGRYAFFASIEGKLTEDAPDVLAHRDVYRYDLEDDSLEYLGAPECGEYYNSAVYLPSLGVAADGETAYWGDCKEIYAWRNGVVKGTGIPFSIFGSSGAFEMSPNGRYLAVEVGGDVADRIGRVLLYDADADQLSCVSCLADGSSGIGKLPLYQRQTSNYVARAVTNSGQVFFTSPERLVAADVNGFDDVYMWQDGKPSLISPGDGEYAAILDDISEDGKDVFFSTAQKLVGQDNDQTTDHYDARIGGGFASQNPPPAKECLRDDCKATPNAGPELPFGGSEALSGPGNVNPPKQKKCGKGKKAKKVKGKVRCVKKHKANKNKKGGNR